LAVREDDLDVRTGQCDPGHGCLGNLLPGIGLKGSTP
jgi:hypothetical protein